MSQTRPPPPSSDVPGSTQGGGEARGLQSLHLLQIQPVRDLLVFLLIVGVIYLGYVLRPLTIPLMLALTLAYLFEPVVRRMTRSGRISRPVAAMAIIVSTVLVVTVPVGIGVTYGTVQGMRLGQQLATRVSLVQASVASPDDEELREKVENLGPRWYWLRNEILALNARDGEAPDPLPAPEATEAPHPRTLARQALAWTIEWVQGTVAGLDAAFGRQALGTGADVVRIAGSAVTRTGYLLFAAFLVLFFFYFFSVSYQRVLASLADLIPAWKRTQTIDMIRKMDGVISGFVRGRLIIMCIQTVMFIIGYWIVGVPAALAVGLVIGVLSLVPYLSLLGIPLTILLMWLQPDPPVWWWALAAPTIVYFIVQLSDDYVWTPLIQGKTTDMDIPSILFAVLAGGILAGFYGVLLAIPAAACIKILLKEAFWPRFKAWSEGRARDFLPIAADRGADDTAKSE